MIFRCLSKMVFIIENITLCISGDFGWDFNLNTSKVLSSRNRSMTHPFLINMFTALKGSQF